MSKLISSYSHVCGLEVRRPFLLEKFFPLAETKYITIQGGSGQPSKCYDYYNEVTDFLLPILRANNITLIQLGGKDDVPIKNCKHLMGATTFGQVSNIVKGSLLHIGNDSWITHLAGMLGIPLVALYGSTSVQNHGPYWYNKDNSFFLESHRNNCIPTYSQEGRKTVNLIPPENVATAALKALNVSNATSFYSEKTLFIGSIYNATIVEYVPNFPLDPRLLPGQPITVRMDYHYNTDFLINILNQNRKVNIVTNKAIDPAILAHFKNNISGITYEVFESDSVDALRKMKRIGLAIKFFSRETDEAKMSELRLKFWDVAPIEHMGMLTKSDFLKNAEQYLNSPLDLDPKTNKIYYRSNKYLLSNGQVFPSKAAWKANQPIPNFESNVVPMLDCPEMWEEFNHFRVFEQLNG